MMKRIFTVLAIALTVTISETQAQYAPQAPLPGNQGIKDDSPLFRDWASGCTLVRGFLDIADTSLGKPTLGSVADVLGVPGSGLLSLGDGGVAVVTFDHSIFNGAGPDFAVFENAFANPENDSLAYLEFAFVEVSSDGINFHRFPASCNIQDTAQIDNFTYTDARFFNNLAGKYIAGYGTPFDLEELKGTPGLDVDHITHVRIIDVVGTLNPDYASYDKDGHIINDPYPSAYLSGGFDLNAVGVMNSNQPPPTSIQETKNEFQVSIFPNPAADVIYVSTAVPSVLHYRLTDINGRKIMTGTMTKNTELNISKLKPGTYLLFVEDGNHQGVYKVNKQ
jgi:hypothetical protein